MLPTALILVCIGKVGTEFGKSKLKGSRSTRGKFMYFCKPVARPFKKTYLLILLANNGVSEGI